MIQTRPKQHVQACNDKGDKNGTKFKSTCLALNTQGGAQPQLVMGFPPITGFSPPQTEPEAPVPPRLRGFSYANIYRSALITE
jgi:hypothetical protein